MACFARSYLIKKFDGAIKLRGTGSLGVTSAVDVDHDGLEVLRIDGRGVHVDNEAVLLPDVLVAGDAKVPLHLSEQADWKYFQRTKSLMILLLGDT